MNPDYTIADAGQGLRAGQKAAWGDKPCHGDVFHISHQCEVLANTLANVARGAKSRRQKLQAKAGKVRQRVPDIDYRVELARQAEAQAHALARDIRTLTAWLSHDVLALAGPSLVTRRDLFDFIVAQLGRREHEDPRRIRPVRTALQNQRDDLLAFAGVLDDKLIGIAQAHGLPEHLVRAACMLHRKPSTSPAYWQGWNRLRARMRGKFHAVFDAVAQAMAHVSQQRTGEEPQLAASQLLHAAPPAGGIVLESAAVLPESSVLPAQPAPRARRKKSLTIDDRTKPSSLAHAPGLWATSAAASLTQGRPTRLPWHHSLKPESRLHRWKDFLRLCYPKQATFEPRPEFTFVDIPARSIVLSGIRSSSPSVLSIRASITIHMITPIIRFKTNFMAREPG